MRKSWRIAECTIIVLIVLVLTVPALVYVPWVQDRIVEYALGALNRNDDNLRYDISRLRLRFPLQIEMDDVLVTRTPAADTVAYVRKLRTGLDALPLKRTYFEVRRLLMVDVRSAIDSTLVSGLNMTGRFDTLDIADVRLDPQSNELRIASILLAAPFADVSYTPDSVKEETDTTRMEPWYIDLGQLDITDADLTYDGWHLDSMQMHVRRFGLDSMHVKFDTLNIDLPESYLAASGDVDLTYLQDSTMGWARLLLDARLSRQDLMMVGAGALPNLERFWPKADITARCNLYVTPDSMRLMPLSVKVPGYVDVEAKAKGSHPFVHPQRVADLNLNAVLTNADSLVSAIYEIPSRRDFRLPESVMIGVKATQYQTSYTADVELTGDSLRLLHLTGRFDEASMAYKADVDVNGLDLNGFLPSIGVGETVLQLNASGRYFDFGRRHTSLDARLNVDRLLYVTRNDSVCRTDTFAGARVDASLKKGDYKLRVESDLAQVSGNVDLTGKYLYDTLRAQGLINLHVPDLGDFDSLHVSFESIPQQMKVLLNGGDANVSLTAACDVYKLMDVADRVGRALDVQATNKAFDINELQKEIPELALNIDMHDQNPLMPVLEHYDLGFRRASIELLNTDSLHFDADIDSLRYDDIQVAAVCARLEPSDGDYDYLGNATYIDTITGLTFDLGVKAYLDSKEIAAVGYVLADSVQTLTFDAFLTHGLEADVYLDDLPLAVANVFLPTDFKLGGMLNGHAWINCDSVDFNAVEAALWTKGGTLYYEGADMTIGLPEDSVRYHDGRLLMEGVRCMTQNGRPIVVNGNIDLRNDYADPNIDLRISADNVRLFRNNRRKTRRQVVYGRLPLSADVRVRGLLSELTVDGRLDIPGGCDLTCYYEDDDIVSQSRLADLVKFVEFNPEKAAEDTVETFSEEQMLMKDRMMNRHKNNQLMVNLKLNIDKATQALVYLPTSSDDRVQLKGGGDLKLTMDAGGKLQLGGKFDVLGGDINFKLPMLPVTKEFAMTSDSWLRWNGQPTEPELHLTATQNVKCTVNDATSGARVVKFLVSVVISGTPDDMNVVFDCSSPDDGAIANELASFTAEDRSKQALMLLIAQTYTGPSASNSSAGLSSANAALSTLLNKEIESLLTHKLKHTNINFDIDTYDATGTGAMQTDYNLSVSQMFFNDRMRVTFGGKMSRGDMVVKRENQIINDVSFEWMIKKDGSNYVRVFRKTNYESVLEGQVIETGAGYVLQRDAYSFWKLFVQSSRKREAAIRNAIVRLQNEEEQKKKIQDSDENDPTQE